MKFIRFRSHFLLMDKYGRILLRWSRLQIFNIFYQVSLDFTSKCPVNQLFFSKMYLSRFALFFQWLDSHVWGVKVGFIGSNWNWRSTRNRCERNTRFYKNWSYHKSQIIIQTCLQYSTICHETHWVYLRMIWLTLR